jgi:hypothetical protein
LYTGGQGVFLATTISANIPGTFDVRNDLSDPTKDRRISRGIVTAGGITVTNQIRIDLAYLARPFEHSIYAGNYDNTPWSFQLRGAGAMPVPTSTTQKFPGGLDSIYGDVYIRGDAYMYDGSGIYRPSSPNLYSLDGDLNTTGTSTLNDSATVAGNQHQNVPYNPPPDLPAMDYAHNNSYDIAKIFNDLNISSGYLPSGHPLRNVVVKNPSTRGPENSSTPGADDFYFEPSNISGAGTVSTAVTPLNLGTNKVYYVDGHVWFNSERTYGFKVDGTATIVATRDIHVSDNLAYNNKTRDPVSGNPPDMLALVALGQYNSSGVRTSNGDVYFGDPEFGSLYTVDAFMFAGNNFYYNTRSNNSTGQEEPDSGFKVFGNYMAVNQVVVLRDWYTANGLPRAALYDQVTRQWKDAITGSVLTSTQLATRRHYAMRVEYDDRIRDAATQMSGLPRGNGTIFSGEKGWEEIQ